MVIALHPFEFALLSNTVDNLVVAAEALHPYEFTLLSNGAFYHIILVPALHPDEFTYVSYTLLRDEATVMVVVCRGV
ncbi:MAG: hypothetical protein K2K25_01570, partial [Muribaculaceae bacterium]|nr:hypothetical protein [Muribaculaceae bacterium]